MVLVGLRNQKKRLWEAKFDSALSPIKAMSEKLFSFWPKWCLGQNIILLCLEFCARTVKKYIVIRMWQKDLRQ